MAKDRRVYVLTSRADDFVVTACPDDPEYGAPFLPLGSRYGAKALAHMALDGSVPVGAELTQDGTTYLWYDGYLWLLDDERYVVNDVPALAPVQVKNQDKYKWERLPGVRYHT